MGVGVSRLVLEAGLGGRLWGSCGAGARRGVFTARGLAISRRLARAVGFGRRGHEALTSGRGWSPLRGRQSSVRPGQRQRHQNLRRAEGEGAQPLHLRMLVSGPAAMSKRAQSGTDRAGSCTT